MKEKIDWYQEVLDLEPGSKVFFPLAKLLAKNDEIIRAVETLQHGLERHPEFIEARLYLIELLHEHSDIESSSVKLEQQLMFLTPLFARYAGFWQAWSNSSQVAGQKGDAALAIAFVAAVFQNSSLSISEIFTKGLQATLGDLQFGDNILGTNTTAIADSASTYKVEATNVVEDSPVIDTQASPVEEYKDETINTDATYTTPTMDFSATQDFDDDDEIDEEEGEERFSLRTRSMAEVLAEQGDYAGSIEIFNELVVNAESEQEKEDLQYRINTLKKNLDTEQEAPVVVEEETSSPGKERILSVLETLAVRLENRVPS